LNEERPNGRIKFKSPKVVPKDIFGDRVVTSGLDNIFLANIPVGIVSEVLD